MSCRDAVAGRDSLCRCRNTAASLVAAPGQARVQPLRCRSDTIEFAAHPAAVSAARLRTRRDLRAWEMEDLAADAALVVSEVTTNAIQAHLREHLNEPVRLTLLAGLGTVLIIVRDASPAPPVPAAPAVDGEAGRGLAIVAALSVAWGWKPSPGGGKTVRVLLRGQRIG